MIESSKSARVAVFLGARDAKRPIFKEQVQMLGKAIALHNIELVYGGSNTGLMRDLADAALQQQGRVIGVTIHALADLEAPHLGLTELYLVDTMHQRKAKMAELADAFIIYPGGVGTLEEFFEIYTWARLGFHSKPIGLLNVDGYFDPLLTLLDRSVEEGFLDQKGHDLLVCETDIEQLLSGLDLV